MAMPIPIPVLFIMISAGVLTFAAFFLGLHLAKRAERSMILFKTLGVEIGLPWVTVALGIFAVGITAISVVLVQEYPIAGPSLDQHRLTVIVEPPNSASVLLSPLPDAQGLYKEGTTVAVEVSPNEGFQIMQWLGDFSQVSGNTVHVNMDSDKTVVLRLVATP